MPLLIARHSSVVKEKGVSFGTTPTQPDLSAVKSLRFRAPKPSETADGTISACGSWGQHDPRPRNPFGVNTLYSLMPPCSHCLSLQCSPHLSVQRYPNTSHSLARRHYFFQWVSNISETYSAITYRMNRRMANFRVPGIALFWHMRGIFGGPSALFQGPPSGASYGLNRTVVHNGSRSHDTAGASGRAPPYP